MKRCLVAGLIALTAAAPAAAQVAPQPPVDRDVLKSTYKPTGFFKPGDTIPTPDAPPAPDGTGIFNPSGHWSAYDSNVFESLNFPGRQSGDETSNDPPGSGDPRFGYCPPHPQYMPQGRCANHSLEFLDYYEKTMKAILGDFGVVVRRYEFENPGRSDVGGAAGEPGGLSSPGGRSYNIAGIVPGADSPNEEVIVSGHYDFTDAAHAAAWDSSEGHAEVIRMAKIMADYWRATGTRPSATVKFMPWAAEESGTFGSEDYVNNHVLADEAQRVRGYFNVDPCAGAYPAFYHGLPGEQVPMVLQLTDPEGDEGNERIKPFNDRAVGIIDEFWADIDDEVDTATGPMPVFTDADRGNLDVALGGLAVFSSDYRNFSAIGVPIFNLFPDMFGPHADGTPASSEGIATIHTPRDNLASLNALTGPDQSGLTASDGWMTGMELCAQLEARYMLQPEMGGAQTANPTKPVAYFEVSPKPVAVPKGKLQTLDATGSHQLASVNPRTYVNDADLQFKWEYGDGTPVAYGKTVKHAYKRVGTIKTKLTVTNRNTGEASAITRLVDVVDGDGNDVDPPGQDRDPGLARPGSVVACQSGTGFSSASVRPAGRGLRFEGRSASGQSFIARVFRATKGRRAIKPKLVASFEVNGSLTWNGKPSRGKLRNGTYYAQLDLRGTGSRADVRSFAFRRKGAKFKRLKAFRARESCDLISIASLSSPVFGGKRRLGISFATTKDSRVRVTVQRGKRVVKRFTRRTTANRLARVTLKPRKLRRGTYRITIKAGAKTVRLYARRL